MSIFVLGAGASAPAGIPLAAELGNRIRADLIEIKGLDVWQRLEDLEIFDADRDFEMNLTRLDIEIQEAMRRGASMNIGAGSRGKTEESTFNLPFFRNFSVPNALSELLMPLQESAESGGATAYLDRFIEKHLQPGDTIITFNYDLLIEAALRRAGLWGLRDGYGVDLSGSFRSLLDEPESQVQVLKLHGSVGWFSIVMGRALLVSQGAGQLLGYKNLETSSRNMGKGITLSQVLPSFVKIMAHYPLPRLWRAAAAALREADRVLFVGYSFPFADSAAHSLFLTNCKPSSELVYVWYQKNSDPTMAQVRGLVEEFEAAGLDLWDVCSCIERIGQVSAPWDRQDLYCPDPHA